MLTTLSLCTVLDKYILYLIDPSGTLRITGESVVVEL
jgi:hypothetical protein